MSAFMTLRPGIAKLAFYLIDAFLFKSKESSESREIKLKLGRHYRETLGIAVVSRFETERQIDAGDAEWKKREEEQSRGNP